MPLKLALESKLNKWFILSCKNDNVNIDDDKIMICISHFCDCRFMRWKQVYEMETVL